jgi:anti-sigma regulatory factor (Ser/Thr protein kinase)
VSGTKGHSSYRHEALLYAGDEEFLSGTLDFLREGLNLGQPCLVAVPQPRLGALADALGADAARVGLVDMGDLGDNPARIIPAWRDFVDREGGQGAPLRGVGEPVWFGRGPEELAECALHEALLNVAVGPDEPLWLRCPYDVSRLDGEAVQRAWQSHPALIEAGRLRGSRSYGGAVLVDELFSAPLPEPPPGHVRREFRPSELADVRHQVSAYARATRLSSWRAEDLVLAVSELATNSLRHGGPRSELRMWGTDEHVVCEIADDGHLDDPLVGRRSPGAAHEGGRGLWMANQLCDLVQVRSSDQGTVVRVFVRFGPNIIGPPNGSVG